MTTRETTGRRGSWALLLSSGLCMALGPLATVRSQVDPASPLPASLEANVSPPGDYAARLILEDDPISNDLLIATIGFDNISTQSTVSLQWSYRDGASAPGLKRTEESVSYKVTAVATRSPTGTTLYTAGWNERSGQPLVERWTFGTFALGTLISPVDGSPTSQVLLPSATRRELWGGGSGGIDVPIAGLAFHLGSQCLWMLTAEASPRLLSLDVSDPENVPAPALVGTVTSFPDLGQARSLKAARLHSGGIFVLAQPRQLWEGLPGAPTPLGTALGSAAPPPPEPRLLVFGDIDEDGTNELSASYTYAEFRALYPSALWDTAFGEP